MKDKSIIKKILEKGANIGMFLIGVSFATWTMSAMQTVIPFVPLIVTIYILYVLILLVFLIKLIKY